MVMGNPHGAYNASSGMTGYGGMPQLFGGGVSGAAMQQPGRPGVGQLAPHQQLRGGPSPLMGLMAGNGQVRSAARLDAPPSPRRLCRPASVHGAPRARASLDADEFPVSLPLSLSLPPRTTASSLTVACVWLCVWLCVSLCDCARLRACACSMLFACVCVRACACVRACVIACVRTQGGMSGGAPPPRGFPPSSRSMAPPSPGGKPGQPLGGPGPNPLVMGASYAGGMPQPRMLGPGGVGQMAYPPGSPGGAMPSGFAPFSAMGDAGGGVSHAYGGGASAYGGGGMGYGVMPPEAFGMAAMPGAQGASRRRPPTPSPERLSA